MAESIKSEDSFGTRVAAARRAAGLTQDQLAEKMGVSKAQISRYESGRDRPGYDRLPALELAVGRSIGFLVTGDESVGGKVIDPQSYELLLKLDKLPPALREFVLGALALAEETKDAIPARFLTSPTKENWHEFHAYLQQLAELIRNKPPSS